MTFEEWLEKSKICPCGYEAVRCAWEAAQKAEREKYKELIETSEGIVLTQEIYGGIPIKMIEHLHEVLERIGEWPIL